MKSCYWVLMMLGVVIIGLGAVVLASPIRTNPPTTIHCFQNGQTIYRSPITELEMLHQLGGFKFVDNEGFTIMTNLSCVITVDK